MRFEYLFINTISLMKEIDLYCGNVSIGRISGIRNSRLTEYTITNDKEGKPLCGPYWEFQGEMSWSSAIQSIGG